MNRIELIGNESIKAALFSMMKSNMLSHSVVIYGDKGMGKKTAARYFGAAALCEDPDGGKPCMRCRSCRMIEHGGHPDFIEVSPSGKNGIYRLESDLRPVVSQAYIKPSEARYKVVVISDMDATAQGSQNVLLKLVEEPPSHLIIIMTACSREYFLPTILSRVTQLRVSPLDMNGLERVVKSRAEKYTRDKLEAAYDAFGGNAGQCIMFLDGKELSLAVEITKEICKAVCEKDEYRLMQAFFKAEGDKGFFKEVLKLFSNSLRDCAVKKSGVQKSDGLSCCKKETEQLALSLSTVRAMELFSLCDSYINRINGNVNVNLALNSICAQIMDLI